MNLQEVFIALAIDIVLMCVLAWYVFILVYCLIMVTPNMFIEAQMRLLAHAPNYFLWADTLKRAAAQEE